MLSILIPVFDYDVTKLVGDLHAQAVALGIDFEIIVLEDGSTLYLAENQTVTSLTNVNYSVLDNNVGRSVVRNMLADRSRYSYLLFIDCDSEVCSNDFVEKYLHFVTPDCVINGGIAYNFIQNKDNYRLRLRYTEREIRTAEERQRLKLSFTTFNLLIDRNLFMQIRFDQRIKGYGYEDLALGYTLVERGYCIRHIDNPLIHKGVDDTLTFINKADIGVHNLWRLYKSNDYPNLAQYSRIIRYYSNIERFELTSLVGKVFRLFRRLIENNLKGDKPSLMLFDFYKLGLLCFYELKNRSKKLVRIRN